MARRRKGTGGIEATRGGKCGMRISTPAGRRRIGVVPTREEADAILSAVRAEMAQAEHVDGITLREWGARTLDRREGEGLLASDTDRSRWAVHVARSALADIPVRSIVKRDILEWLDVMCAKRAADKRERRRLGKQTIQNALNLVRAILGAAVQRGIITENPADGVTVPRRIAPTEDPWTWLAIEEQSMIDNCAAIPEAHRAMMKFAWGTGLREGEMFNLLKKDVRVDGAHPEVTVRFGSKGHGPKSTKGKPKIRRVPLFGPGLDAARQWLDLLPRYAPRNPLGLMFPGPTGARRQKGKHIHVTRRGPDGKPRPVNPLPEYLAAAGIVIEDRHDGRSVRWHDFRHTCAASLVSGMWGRMWSLEEVKGMLGHSTVTVTERYAHLADSALRVAASETGGLKPAIGPLPHGTDANDAAQVHEIIAGATSGPRTPDLRFTKSRVSPSDLAGIDAAQVRERAYAALREIGAGGHALAGALLVDLLTAGHAEAGAALAEVASGKWGPAIGVLERLVADGASVPLPSPVPIEAGRKKRGAR